MHPTKTNFPPADIGAPVGVSSDIDSALEPVGSILCAVHEVSSSSALQPEVRLIGAQALLDELTRALARMAIDLQPEGFPDPTEPDR